MQNYWTEPVYNIYSDLQICKLPDVAQGVSEKIVVTATSGDNNRWVLTSDENNEVRYRLYADEEGKKVTTEWTFTEDSSQPVYAGILIKGSASNLASGDYEATITFTANVVGGKAVTE